MVKSSFQRYVLILLFSIALGIGASGSPTSEQIATWANHLEEGSFAERESATIGLFKAEELALPSLVAALESDSPEASRRAAFVLRRFVEAEEFDLSAATHHALREIEAGSGEAAARRAKRLIEAAEERTIRHLKSLGATFGVTDGEIDSAFFNSNWKGEDTDLQYLSGMSSITRLNTSNSKVSDAALAYLSLLPNLETLDIGKSKIAGPGLAHLKHVPKLTSISLQDLPITDEHTLHLSALPNLERLGLDGTGIGNGAIKHIGGLAKLDTLYLNGTSVTDLSPLEGSESLRVLFASSTKIPASGIASLTKIPSLRYISLQGSTVGEGVPEQIGKLKQIETLGLDESGITDAGIEQIKNLTQLQKLWVNGTALTNEAIPSLANLSGLQVLYTEGTKMTPEGIERLAAQLENCKVHREDNAP